MLKRLKRCCAMFAATLGTIAAIFAFPATQAATPSHADLDNPTLVVRLDGDGSLIVSQRGKDAGTPVTLPSIKALPAEIDALVPRTADRTTLAIAADSTGPYGNLNYLMFVTRKAGFAKVAILGPEKEPGGGPSELTIRLQGGPTKMDSDGLFMSLGEDGKVIVSLGLGPNAHETVVNLENAPDTAAGLVPKGRAKKHAYFRADLTAPIGNALSLLRRLGTAGFKNITFVGEEPEEN